MDDLGNPQPTQSNDDLAELTASIVSAYVSHNSIPPGQLSELIRDVGSALREQTAGAREPEPEPQAPAIPIRRSVTEDAIICLECGRRFKSIRRHIRNAHGLEPQDYRAKWGLPPSYPITAPSYARRRSELAKGIGLGRKPRSQ